MKSKPRIAFVLDALPSLGGGEKVLFAALEAYPTADVFSLIYNKSIFAGTPIEDRPIRTSYLNVLPFIRKYHRLFLPLMPHAIESFNFHGYELIVSFNYAVAHGIRNCNGARHVAYTYTPMRYAWTDVNLDGTRSRKNLIMDQLMKAFRKWDMKAAARIHEFAAISNAVAERINAAWRREARVIFPPVEIERFHPSAQRQAYYITVSRLVPHKRIDLIVRAFSRLQLPLIVIGDGPEVTHLKGLAGPNVQFTGYESDQRTAKLLNKARGFISAAEEDFGIAIVEAQAAGCPVVSYKKGGALESVLENRTGLFFEEQTVESVMEAIREFEKRFRYFNPADAVENAQTFGKARFLREFKQFAGFDD